MNQTTTRQEATMLLKQYVEYGRRTASEAQDLINEMRVQVRTDLPLKDRPFLSVSIPGTMINALDSTVVFGVMRRAIDDKAIRTIARQHPETWLDGRWYPSDATGIHLVLVGRISIQNSDGISPETVQLLDVDADEKTVAGRNQDSPDPKFIHMRWRMPR